LLAQDLYDSYRRAAQDRLPEQIEETNNSVRRGFVTDARQLEESAREGLQRLRDDIEQATDGILAGETEALRRARDELNDLTNQLNEEINRSAPRPGQAANSDNSEQRNERRGSSSAQNDQREEQGAESRQPPSGNQGQQQADEQDQRGEGQPADSPGSGQNPEQRQDRQGQSDPQGRPSNEPQKGGSGGRQPSADRQPPESLRQPSGQREPRQDQQNQPGQQPGEDGRPREGNRQSDNQSNAGDRRQPSDDRSLRRATGGGGSRTTPRLWGDDRPLGPLTGDGFRDWSERLRDVEEMVSDPDLKTDAARIRDRAQQVRKDLIRHSQEPNWDLVRMSIAKPLVELRDRVSQELQKRESKKALVPIDRDPVPAPYVEQVRRYYERIGSGQ
jgi:hypothetical protein